MSTIETASFVWHNGTIVPKDRLNNVFDIKLFMSTHLVETFFTNGTDILFFDETFARLRSLALIYRFDSKLLDDDTGETFINEMRRLLIRNLYYKTARCYLLFCEGQKKGTVDEFLFIEPSPTLFSSENILKMAVVSSKFLKPSGTVMNLPTIEHEFRKLIRSEFEHSDADDCIILNQEQQVVESYHGNIFLVDGKRVLTPSVKSGCAMQLLRGVAIKGFEKLGYEVTGVDELSVEALFDTKEVIIAGSTGIFSLKGLEYKRYFDTTRKLLIDKIVAEG
jgi:branched-subunit amino acid aminotransferase/4-amino-4-deoxychorismate lyase